MAWQYTEYVGFPYLTDWIKRDFKFGIENHGTVTSKKIEKIILPSGETIEAIVYKTDQRLMPCFHLRVGSNSTSILNLKLTSRGLVKEIWTPDRSVMHGIDYSEEPRVFKYQPVGYGEFNDFKLIGEYAVKRLPEVSSEIILPQENFIDDIPVDAIEEIQKYSESCSGVVCWEKTEKDIEFHFFNYFIVSMVSELDKSSQLRKKTNPFSKSQVKELKVIVEPLNPYKK